MRRSQARQKTRKPTRKKPEKPLTLSGLVRYNNKIFLPALNRRLATKKELNGVKEDLSEVKVDLNEVKEKLYQLSDKLSDVPDTLDKILKITEDTQQENTMQVAANQRFDKHLENHETRITKLELATKSAA